MPDCAKFLLPAYLAGMESFLAPSLYWFLSLSVAPDLRAVRFCPFFPFVIPCWRRHCRRRTTVKSETVCFTMRSAVGAGIQFDPVSAGQGTQILSGLLYSPKRVFAL
ncbi:hypothetical protein KCP73_16800 [Salmonella enterica subsp. enterica]|nr:hypothetical protein KCP73_16800 [Salmonella enterica subsp. enterica]